MKRSRATENYLVFHASEDDVLSVGLVNKISRKNHVGDQSPLSNTFTEARVSLFTPFYLSRGGKTRI